MKRQRAFRVRVTVKAQAMKKKITYKKLKSEAEKCLRNSKKWKSKATALMERAEVKKVKEKRAATCKANKKAQCKGFEENDEEECSKVDT